MKKILFLALCLVQLSAVMAQDKPSIRIKGEARKLVMPDQAVFDISINSTRKTEEESVKHLQELSAEVQKKLRGLGFTEDQIKLNAYSTNITYDYSDGKQKITGYTSNQHFRVKFPLDKDRVQRVYKTVLAGPTDGLNVNFTTDCSDSLNKRIENELIVMALRDSREKADLMASTMNYKVLTVEHIIYNVDNQYPVPMMQKAFRSADAEAGAPADYFSIAEQEFSRSVEVHFGFGLK
ncbi:MAG: SIMPL domain-containing protein [Bacteroidota bacterium]